jgi:hypothetical protein
MFCNELVGLQEHVVEVIWSTSPMTVCQFNIVTEVSEL